jgi:hypothetical protein
MKVLIGVDPPKATLAVAAVKEAKGQLLKRAVFPQERVGLRALERWARRFPERRWAMENAGGLGVGTFGGETGSGRRVCGGRAAQALGEGEGALELRWQRPQERRGRCPRHRLLSASRSERLAPVDPEADSEVLRLSPRGAY